MQEIFTKKSLREQSFARRRETRKSRRESQIVLFFFSSGVACLLLGMLMLGVLDIAGELDGTFQRIGLMMVLIPTVALGLSVRPR